jgi:hypothetical protein
MDIPAASDTAEISVIMSERRNLNTSSQSENRKGKSRTISSSAKLLTAGLTTMAISTVPETIDSTSIC